MADIRPFKGIRYNIKKLRLEEVITEPYDRIPPWLQEEYYRKNPYNVVRIILGKDDDSECPGKDKYKRAKIYLDNWLSEGILVKEDQSALYFYEQEFQINGKQKRRLGLISRVKLEEFFSKKVLPHERTFPKYKTDRLNLLRTTNTNTEQIFLLYKDDDLKVGEAIQAALEKAEIGTDIQDEDGFRHRLWIVKDREAILKIQEAMAAKVLIIADGHHRYETSLNYRKEIKERVKNIKGSEPFNSVMMTLFRLDDPGLVILPTFRLVRGLDKLSEEKLKELLAPYFEIEEIKYPGSSYKSILSEVQEKVDAGKHVFAAYISEFGKYLLFRLRSEDILDNEISNERSKEWKRLDVAILHSLIIEKLEPLTSYLFSLENNVSYLRNLEEALEKVEKGEQQIVFLLKPVSLDQIREIVENGELMPQKSTDFFPKLKSGLVMNPLDE